MENVQQKNVFVHKIKTAVSILLTTSFKVYILRLVYGCSAHVLLPTLYLKASLTLVPHKKMFNCKSPIGHVYTYTPVQIYRVLNGGIEVWKWIGLYLT